MSFKYTDHKGYFHVWLTKRGKYAWSALAAQGEEEDLNKAIAASREWIKYNYLNYLKGEC